MKLSDIRAKSITEIKEELVKLRKALEETSLSSLQKKEKNVKKAGWLKKDIARLLTITNEKETLNALSGKEQL